MPTRLSGHLCLGSLLSSPTISMDSGGKLVSSGLTDLIDAVGQNLSSAQRVMVRTSELQPSDPPDSPLSTLITAYRSRYNHPSSRRTWLSSLSAVLPWFEIPKVWARPMSRFGPLSPPSSRLRFSASSVLYKSNPIQKLTRKISATIISFSSTVNPTPASLSSLPSVDSNDDGYCLAKQLFMLGLAQHNCFRTSKKLSTIEFTFSRFSNPVSSTSW